MYAHADADVRDAYTSATHVHDTRVGGTRTYTPRTGLRVPPSRAPHAAALPRPSERRAQFPGCVRVRQSRIVLDNLGSFWIRADRNQGNCVAGPRPADGEGQPARRPGRAPLWGVLGRAAPSSQGPARVASALTVRPTPRWTLRSGSLFGTGMRTDPACDYQQGLARPVQSSD